MTEVKLILVKDEASSETRQMERYVFGKPGSQISGVIYFKKGVDKPDRIVLTFREEKSDEGKKA